ncbi:MAG: dihydropteroate synthase [Chloroflexota bacterium]|jgi:5-methyltetrahydrofolate--homocysteine methyltransferase
MQTELRGKSRRITIDGDGPFVIIGESINPTRRKKLLEAYAERQFQYVLELAQAQIENGADVLDVNAGVAGIDEVSLLPVVVQAIAAAFDVPLCLDSAYPEAIAAALAVAPGRCLINSVNGKEESLDALLPVAKEFDAPLIGLVMDNDGISMDPNERLAVAGKIIERAAQAGIPPENVIIDPLVMAVGADHNAGWVTLETIARVRQQFGVNIVLGASNVSFGLPERQIINQAFLSMAMSRGASCAITNPAKLTSTIRAADLLLGKDNYSMRYIKHYRQTQKSQN